VVEDSLHVETPARHPGDQLPRDGVGEPNATSWSPASLAGARPPSSTSASRRPAFRRPDQWHRRSRRTPTAHRARPLAHRLDRGRRHPRRPATHDVQRRRTADGTGPALGEHNYAILAELGLLDEDIPRRIEKEPSDAQAAIDQVTAELGAPTVLVNNAGITRDNLLFKMTETDWDAVMGVHLKGSFLMTKAAQKHMVDAGWGRIVNLSSTSALGNRGQANYSTAKAGLQGFTKTLAMELGRFGITANCIAPGFIASDMTRATADRSDVPWEQYVHDRAKAIPVQRAGQVDDIAHAVSFFVDNRSGFVPGQVIYVAGGPRA
jgi:3-oxoacyl-[acyl-carrier protein] reductase